MNEYAVERLLDALQSLTLEVQLFREAYVAHNSPRLERIDEPQTYITEDRDTQILDAWQVKQTDCPWK